LKLAGQVSASVTRLDTQSQQASLAHVEQVERLAVRLISSSVPPRR
jgi:hypothetical protein